MKGPIKRLLLGCVVSNAAFGAAGLVYLDRTPAQGVVVASGQPTTTAAGPTTTFAPAVVASTTPTTIAAPATSAPTPSPARRKTTRTTTPAAAAAGDATGIASSVAPSAPARVAPAVGSYGVDIAGSASVGGRAQSVPTSGSVVFATAGNNVRQSSPNTPGNVVLLQRFSGAKSELVTLELTAGDTKKVFTPSSPVTYLLYNAPSGTTWTWTASSTDGKTRVSATGRVGGTKDITIGGLSVRAVEVVTDLQISGDINGSAQLTTWASPDYRLPLVQHQHIDASARGLLGLSVRLLSDTISTLRSVNPT